MNVAHCSIEGGGREHPDARDLEQVLDDRLVDRDALQLGGQGGTYSIQRTITLDADTQKSLEAGVAVVVVHGLDPATAGVSSEVFGSPSEIAPELPLGATSPALCGTLVKTQMGAMPSGGADTGDATESSNSAGMIALGGGLVLAAAAGGTFAVRRRAAHNA